MKIKIGKSTFCWQLLIFKSGNFSLVHTHTRMITMVWGLNTSKMNIEEQLPKWKWDLKGKLSNYKVKMRHDDDWKK